MKKVVSILKTFINERAGVVYIVLTAIAIAVATFIENDFGTAAAQKWIYKATWFELLLALLGLSVGFSAFKYKLLKRKLYAVLLFHISIIIILIGAGVTRIWGFEGMMGIREGQSENKFISSEPYITYAITDKTNQTYGFNEEVLFSSLGGNQYEQTIKIKGVETQVELIEAVPNAQKKWIESESGRPNLKVVFSNNQGRTDDYILQGDQKQVAGIPVNFNGEYIPGAINFYYRGSDFFVRTDLDMSVMTMATRETFEFKADEGEVPLKFRSLYQFGGLSMVIPSFSFVDSGYYEASSIKTTSGSLYALKLKLKSQEKEKVVWVEGRKGQIGKPESVELGDLKFDISYGSIYRELPFSIKLNDFEMERYPGTNSPASFSSRVTLDDPINGENFDYHIYMNHILDHGGYRFFQSSYDRDEKGTYLSVNHDFWGTWISYLGYALLTVGMIWTLFAKGTRFSMLRKATSHTMIVGFMLASNLLHADVELGGTYAAADAKHAELASNILVQDVQGRMKPMHTFSREIMRKMHGSENWNEFNADQIILGIYGSSESWDEIPLIKLGKDEKLKGILNASNLDHLSFRGFFDEEGKYKLTAEVEESNRKEARDRNAFDKALINLDERVSIYNLLRAGAIFRWVPIKGDNNRTWTGDDHHKQKDPNAARFFNAYRKALHSGLKHGNYDEANKLLKDLYAYQLSEGKEYIPSATQRNSEILLNKSKVFKRLALLNTLIGLGFLISLFIYIFRSKPLPQVLIKSLVIVSAVSFLVHTIGLGLRWYVSERAPWSNGYESMIYIAWTAVLAGLIFNRKSMGAMSATFILSGITLFIAHLSFLNPEITPLVPVLKSYWLTIHVSLEAGSYGFLLLGGIIGYLNLLLYATANMKSKDKSYQTIEQLTKLSEITITGGLIMLSIGTYLGGVWANESWGRYWGWDAKETWALVSVLVYAFILHMRFIPKFRGNFAFNVASIVGFASVLMTYYGVNYYLSGLHSYAAGDPVPIPQWVYWAVALVMVTIAFAKWKESKLTKS